MLFETSVLRGSLVAATALAGLAAPAARADQIINDDLIVNQSLCVGNDCVNGENFGFDTVILKENNLRLFFNDTSSSGSFPSNDWRLEANDSANGGGNYFSVVDATSGRRVSSIEAGAPAHSLYVDDGGRLGMGTSTPVVQAHMVDGNTPTLRLEQDGSSGFTPITWDLAGNEANFFLREASNASTLVMRVYPGNPESTMVLRNGRMGVGTANPSEKLHIRETASNENADIRIESANAAGPGSGEWEFAVRGVDGDFAINDVGTSGAEFIFRGPASVEPGLHITNGALYSDGDIVTDGSFVSSGTTLSVPDYVFAEDYDLMSLTELRDFISLNSHLPNVPSAAEVQTSGLDLTSMQLTLLEKVEELTLYTLAQQDRIDALEAALERTAQ